MHANQYFGLVLERKRSNPIVNLNPARTVCEDLNLTVKVWILHSNPTNWNIFLIEHIFHVLKTQAQAELLTFSLPTCQASKSLKAVIKVQFICMLMLMLALGVTAELKEDLLIYEQTHELHKRKISPDVHTQSV